MDPGLLSNSFAPLRRPSYRKKCFERSSTFPLRRIDTVYRVPETSRESVDAWKNIPSGRS